MNTDLVLSCPECAAAALADDEFCESCGTPLGARRDASFHHVEIDAGPAAGISDRGLVHQRNEDALFVASAERGAVAVVCDGVSSSAGSQVAARIAAGVIGDRLAAALGRADDARVLVADALAAADEAVRLVPWMPAGGRDAPSCTVVAGLWDGVAVTVGWAGDSRAYWLDASGARHLTRDDSCGAHVITRWLGADAPSDEPTIESFRPLAPGRLMLCSDGLWNHLHSTEELAALVNGQRDASAISVARSLTRVALSRGGHDNVTVAVVDIDLEEP